MVGTTPMIILREPLSHICIDSDEDLASFGRTYETDDLDIINRHEQKLGKFMGALLATHDIQSK